MSEKKTENYGVNIRELVRLLGGRLYSNPGVVLRELVSNASDACVIALAEGASNVHIRVYHEGGNQLVVKDTGRGMTEEELRHHLSVVANSSKRDAVMRLRSQGQAEFADRIIGEFGLGFLTTFVISEHVVVETFPTAEGGASGWRWESQGDTRFTLEALRDGEPGTTIRMTIDTREHPNFTGSRYVRDQIRKYSRQITVPIYYGIGEEAEHLNPSTAPWSESGPDARARWREFLAGWDTHSDAAEWLSAVPICSEDVQGVLYFPCYNATPQRQLGTVDMYCKGVLVEQDNHSIIPKPIRCVRGMLQSPHFALRLDRESVVANERFQHIQRELESAVLQHLSDLATRPDARSHEELAAILRVHDHVIMEGCLTIRDEDTFTRIAELIPISTTYSSHTSLPEYLERARSDHPNDSRPRIFYFQQSLGSRQLSTLVRKRRWELIDCSFNLYLVFLQRYAHIKEIQIYDIAEELDLLFDPVEAEGGWQEIVKICSEMSAPGITLEAKLAHSQSAEMPLSLVNPGQSGGANRSRTERETGTAVPPGTGQVDRSLYVNRNNPLLQQLVAQIESKTVDHDLLYLVIREMFLNTLVFADEAVEPVQLFEHHQRILTELCSLSDQVARLEQERLNRRTESRGPAAQDVERAAGPAGDGSVFVGMPFKAEFTMEVYEAALKPAIQAAGLRPVMLQEHFAPGDIPQEIVEGIANASAAVFDVTEPNPNVYYELGLAHGVLKSGRTALICKEEAMHDRAFDTRHYRVLPYSFRPSQFADFRTKLGQFLSEVAAQQGTAHGDV